MEPYNVTTAEKAPAVNIAVIAIIALAVAGLAVRLTVGGNYFILAFGPLLGLAVWRSTKLASALTAHWAHVRHTGQLDLVVGGMKGKGVIAPVWKDRSSRLTVSGGTLYLQTPQGSRSFDVRAITIKPPSFWYQLVKIETSDETIRVSAVPGFDAAVYWLMSVNRALAAALADACALNGAPQATAQQYPQQQYPQQQYPQQQYPQQQYPQQQYPQQVVAQSPAPGWYPDQNGQQRWWDGQQWTDHVS